MRQHGNGPRLGSLFSGYGGLEQATNAAFGSTTAWVSDIDKGACKILAHRFPDVPNLGDITSIDWSTVEPVDIITGGSPCQDLSHAGKRGGMSEGTRSNLWVAMREAITELKPQYVIWENVRGAYSAAADSEVEQREGLLGVGRPGPYLRALGRVLGDLSDLGYVGQYRGLRAADVGAPHGRFRVFVVATDTRRVGGHEAVERDGCGSQASDWASVPDESDRDVVRTGPERTLTLLPTPACNDMGAGKTVDAWDAWTDRMKSEHGNGNGHGASLSIEALRLLPTPRATRGGSNTETQQLLGTPTATMSRRSDEFASPGESPAEFAARHDGTWDQYAPAITCWEHVIGRPAPSPTEATGRDGAHRLSARFVEWMMGLPDGWVVDVPGLTRNQALKALGNGVVPQQAYAAITHMLTAQEAAA